MRVDHKIIDHWISPNIRVLDLGCGDGTLLESLIKTKNVRGYGLEIDADGIQACVNKGLNIVEQDLDKGLSNFDDQSFDMVILSQTLQTMHYPDSLLKEIVRVGRECIVTIPNFGYWRTRCHLMFKGRMPTYEHLPHQWYDTPNIHFCTFRDFNVLCQELNLTVIDKLVVAEGSLIPLLRKINPNLFGEIGIFRLRK